MGLEAIFSPDSFYSLMIECFPIFMADIGCYFEYPPYDFFLTDFDYQMAFLALL